MLVHTQKLISITISPALFPAINVNMVTDRKTQIVLRTNQIAGLVTVPSWKKKVNTFELCSVKKCLQIDDDF